MFRVKQYIAEFIGTLVLVVFGCGTAVVVGCDSASGSGYLLTALAFGLVIVAMAYSIGNVSGCHINPAVSLTMLISGRMKALDCLGYIAAQFLGGIAGAGILAGLFGADTGLGANGLYEGSVGKSIAIEIILTFVFVIAVLGVTGKTDNSRVAGLVIGLSLTLVHIFGIGLTGTSVNPARSFGPALLAGGELLSGVWVFIVAPVIGSVLAALAYVALTPSSKKPGFAKKKKSNKK